MSDRKTFPARMKLIVEKINNRKDVLSCHEFWYREVLELPRVNFQKLIDSGWEFDIDKAVAVIDPKLLRYKKEELTKGII